MKKYINNVKEINASYSHMISRCYSKKDISYKNYGAKGVRVCKEWKSDYQKFLDWSLANGWKKGLELDKDINGNGMLYSPNTCMWVTRQENCRHRRSNVKFIVNGECLILKDVSELTGIERRTISRRLKLGWSKDEAVNKKLRGSELKNFGAFDGDKLIHKFITVDDAVKVLGGDRKKYWRALTGRTNKSRSKFTFKFLNETENKETDSR